VFFEFGGSKRFGEGINTEVIGGCVEKFDGSIHLTIHKREEFGREVA